MYADQRVKDFLARVVELEKTHLKVIGELVSVKQELKKVCRDMKASEALKS